ncbi:hypothetical protein B0O99DRAFT_685645 [Bisporella sp. PMI_857]|nr:hypothetical protein B0O99DRAFT_685645 [Bisporella sp. PMI_857]
MSGLEAIGLVLGLYPVLLKACQIYKAAKSGTGIDKVIQRLQTERLVYKGFVNNLLLPDVNERQLALLVTSTSAQVVHCWNNEDIFQRVKARHGFETTKQILSIIKDLGELLQSIEKELPGVARSFEKQQSRFRFGLRNVKLNFPDSTTQSHLAELREYNESLRRLVAHQVLPNTNGPWRQPLPTFEIPQYDCRDAKYIYSAICDGYRCNCNLPHLASLEMPDIGNSLTLQNAPSTTRVLQLLFQSADLGLRIPSAQTTPSNMPSLKKHDSCAISIYECQDDHIEPIPDLCTFVRTVGSPATVPTTSNPNKGILEAENKKYSLNAASLRESIADVQNVVSLEELTNPGSNLERADRMSLAVRLTYAIIQYYSTGWIDPSWTWKDFSVAGNNKKADGSQLFIAQRFYSKAINTSIRNKLWAGWETIGEPILTRLGFALIELALGKRLQELRDATIDPNAEQDAQDYYTAQRLLITGRVRRAESEAYEIVVKACLGHQFTDSHYSLKYLDSRDETFSKDVEQCILKPLHCMWKEQWGGTNRQMCY